MQKRRDRYTLFGFEATSFLCRLEIRRSTVGENLDDGAEVDGTPREWIQVTIFACRI